MITNCTHILKIDDSTKVNEKILSIKASLGDRKHKIYILKDSIAVQIEESRKLEEHIKISDKKISYDEFLYNMRKLKREFHRKR